MDSKDQEALRQAEAFDSDEAPAVPQGKTPGKTFDVVLVEKVDAFIGQLLLEHGDNVRSIGVFFDYFGNMNMTPGIHKGALRGHNGTVATADAVIGSLQASIIMTEELLLRAAQLEEAAREDLSVLLSEITSKGQELEELQTKIAETKAKASEPEKGE